MTVPAMRRFQMYCAPVVAALLLACQPTSALASDNVVRATLSNGLKVIVVKNSLAPVVATSVNYRVGSNESPAGFPGTAHAQEHMMFRGSPGLSADQLAMIGSEMGGDFNANTNETFTQYLYTVPAEDLDVALHIEAIRMRAVDDSTPEWDKERGAIEQEVAQDLSMPNYTLASKLRTALFAGTPYEHDALGTKPSFDKTTAKMLHKFHDTWYTPNNATLIVVGDVDPEAALASIKTLFGDIKAKKLPKRPALKLRPVKPTTISVDTDRPNGMQMLAMRMPGLDSPDFPALEVLSDVLANRRFDLYGLVPQGKALSASFYIEPLPRASIGYTEVSFTTDTDIKTLQQDVREILKNVIKNGVPPELVDAAKMQERRAAEFQKNSISGLASIWAEAVTSYGLKNPDEDLERIEKVTVADVNRVARKYLDLDHAVVATMTPHGSGRPVPMRGGGFGGQESIKLGEVSNVKLPAWASKAATRLAIPHSTLSPTVTRLANGITLIVQPEDVSDTISLYGHIRNREDIEAPKGKDGVGQILSHLFQFGTERMGRVEFQAALDAIGASENAGTSFGVQTLASSFDKGVALLADNELHPALPKRAFEIVQQQYAALLHTRNQSPGFLVHKSLVKALFPENDPTLRDATPETVHSLSMDDVHNYYRQVYRPDLTTVVVMGRITPDAAKAVVQKYFGGWTATGPTPETELPAVPDNKPGTVNVPDTSRVQDVVILAQTMGVTRKDKDYYPIALGDAVLGGSFYSTRLSIDLRKNSGLVYSVGTGLEAGKNRSIYIVQYACDPQNVSKARDIVNQDLAAMQNKPVPEDELRRTKALLLRQIPLGESSVDAIAGSLINRQETGLPLDEPTVAAKRYIDLTPADVMAAFKKWMRPNDLVQVSQGPAPK